MSKLVGIDSVNPNYGGPGEAEIARVIASELEGLGLDVETQKVEGERFNVVGTLRGLGEGRTLLLNGHMDTVGAENMTIVPFKGQVVNGKLYGRGACDMKGSIAAMISAVQAILLSRMRLHGNLILSFVVDEEYKSAGMERLVETVRADSAIVGEPTGMEIGLAHKGFVWLEVECRGKAAHGSVPETGVDAIMKMGDFLVELKTYRDSYPTGKHKLLGGPVLHSSTIEGGREWAMVPDLCILGFERRTLPGESSSDVVREFQSIAERLAAKDPSFQAEVKLIFEGPPMEIDGNAPLVKTLVNAAQQHNGSGPRLVGMPFWTDAAILSSKAKIPSCLYGPGRISSAHTAEEHVEINDVCRAAKVYAHAAADFCGTA